MKYKSCFAIFQKSRLAFRLDKQYESRLEPRRLKYIFHGNPEFRDINSDS